MGIVPVIPHSLGGEIVQSAVAVVEQLGNVIVVVLARIEETCDSGGADGGSPVASIRAVLHTAGSAVNRALFDVRNRSIDNNARRRDARIATRAKSLDLRNGGRAFVGIAALRGADVPPSSCRRLCFSRELDGTCEDADELVSPRQILFFAEHLREKEHRVAVSVGVAIILFGIADQTTRLALTLEEVDRGPHLDGVLSMRRGRAFRKEGHASHGGHGGGIASFVSLPGTLSRLLRREPGQPSVSGLTHVFPRRILASRDPRKKAGRDPSEDDCSPATFGWDMRICRDVIHVSCRESLLKFTLLPAGEGGCPQGRRVRGGLRTCQEADFPCVLFNEEPRPVVAGGMSIVQRVPACTAGGS